MANFYPDLQQYASSLPGKFEQITEERKHQLQQVGEYCLQQRKAGKKIQLIVICTHNSRRSHMGQLWLQAAAHYYDIPEVYTFSGGTEATAFNPNAVRAMKDAGFDFSEIITGDNPVYVVTMDPNDPGQKLFSKRFYDPPNPSSNFAAILVCSEADQGCPFIPGADQRFPIPYQDPKEFDNTPREAEAYADRCRQIAREMFYLMQFAVV